MAVRQRKIAKKPDSATQKVQHKPGKKSRVVNIAIIFGVFFGTLLAGWLYSEYEKTKFYTPFPAPSAVTILKSKEKDMELFWGTYRPQLYFGMKTRTEESLLFGMLWFSQYSKTGDLQLRYTCEQNDNLPKYGWLYHDGRKFGVQEIVDDDYVLTTEFIKITGGDNGGDWTARIKGDERNGKVSGQVVSLLFAFTHEDRSNKLKFVFQGNKVTGIEGFSKELGHFRIRFRTGKGYVEFSSYSTSYQDDIYSVKDSVLRNLQYQSTKSEKSSEMPFIELSGSVKDKLGRKPNTFVYQFTFRLPFEVDVIFESLSNENRDVTLTGERFTVLLNSLKDDFDEQFERKFGLEKKNFTSTDVEFAKAALSNMIGGIGYFHGSSIVMAPFMKQPAEYFPSSLYTGVPSRSFFPRGFLWDEGFHQMLIQVWDPQITYESLAHWFDQLNYKGWLPREQILGVEARRKVPDEFVVQHRGSANPPTFFLTIEALIEKERTDQGVTSTLKDFLKHIYPRLKGWFEWYNTTQKGELPGTYRWHGREKNSFRELNPKTLTSGLDDYPRASHPSDDERHVDLRCWIALAAGILADIANLIGENEDGYRNTEKYLKDNELLNYYHWSNELSSYADYGNHTKYMKLEWVRIRNQPNVPKKLIRVDRSKTGPISRHVGEFGYVSLFPLLLRILDPSSPKLKIILGDIRNPEKLWTSYGLRSLSKSAPSYNKYNTEHDKPYWRGPIWININFLAVRALRHYSKEEGPYKEIALEIYRELRYNLIRNVIKEYKRTGYIWEQYKDTTGEGQGCYPFTGWSALIPLVMAEIF